MMSTNNRQSKKKSNTKKGFTLIEMLVSTFIFVIITSAIVIIFSRQTASFSYIREQQRNIENARFAMSFMSKTLRTSSIAALKNSDQTIYVYDFAHPGKPCFRFDLSGGGLFVTQGPAVGTSVDSCGQDSQYNDADDRYELTTGDVTGFFVIRETERDDPSTNSNTDSDNELQVGLITVSLSVGDSTSTVDNDTIIQTSVSLQDYPGELDA